MSTDTKAPPTPNPMNDGVNRYPRPETGKNWPLIDATRNFIESIPSVDDDEEEYDDIADGNAWNQRKWRCMTGMCYAGWASALTGATFPYAADDYTFIKITAGDSAVGGGTIYALDVVRDADGKTWHIQEYAAHMLGITAFEARKLFAPGKDDLESIDVAISAIRDNRIA